MGKMGELVFIYTKACAKKLSQILTNNIDNGGRGLAPRIYARYCLKK